MDSGTSTNLTFDENIMCPICLETPHNAVLLNCSSYDKGCRPFMCNTDSSLSNCFDQYQRAKGFSAATMVPSTASEVSSSSSQNFQVIPLNFDGLTCPFCRGDVTGFSVVDNVRAYLDMKKRSCQEMDCGYVGNYVELQQHARQEHPNSRPSEVDPERQRAWEIFQQSVRDSIFRERFLEPLQITLIYEPPIFIRRLATREIFEQRSFRSRFMRRRLHSNAIYDRNQRLI
ncbi:hypothetical protein ZIOFF_072580 [Zingiber officinale]|uniref:Uncharacterized protein n=1 Tax=Zingiber officinale TaxID=94328 RepID=A0A8J5ESB1_ZINOF|nr:hypothetical protein ZIOFF_072580 [Zingiber officinale]